MGLLRDKTFAASLAGHFGVDLLNGQRPLLLAFLSVPLGLSNATIGLISTIYLMVSSISQPVFGALSDRVGPRWVATGGVLWMSFMFGLAVLQPGQASLALLTLAALGSAAFHPAGTVEATDRAREYFSGSETATASLFFMLGQAGYSVGPILGGPIVDQWGAPGLLVLLVLVVPTGFALGRTLQSRDARLLTEVSREKPPRAALPTGLLVPLVLMTACRSWAQTNMMTFLPKYHSDLGTSPTVYGIILGFLMAGSALGGVGGGWLADRFGKRKIAFWTLLTSALPLAVYHLAGDGALACSLAALAGALTGASHGISVVLAQKIIPARAGVASGLALGFTFSSGALGTYVSGLQADASGFPAVFLTTAGICLAGALMALLMRSE